MYCNLRLPYVGPGGRPYYDHAAFGPFPASPVRAHLPLNRQEKERKAPCQEADPAEGVCVPREPTIVLYVIS